MNVELLKTILQVRHYDNKIRLGCNHDGGYVIADINKQYDCYISAGVGYEESFSRDLIKKYKMNEYNSYAFDGTIKEYPHEFTKDISFINKNIGDINDGNLTNLSHLISKNTDIFLKMDIEGGEYPWLMSIDESQLVNFKQIVIELHGITGDEWGCDFDDKIKCMNKLLNNHFIVHAHGNNNSHVVDGIPDVIELTLLNKNCFIVDPELNRMLLPSRILDSPNSNSTKDIDLNIHPFVNLSYIQRIFIGDSSMNTKIIQFDKTIIDEIKSMNCKFELVWSGYEDTFDFELGYNSITVRRTDLDSGWGHHHIVYVYHP